MEPLGHTPDLAVLENPPSLLRRYPDDDIHHGPGQVIGPNNLVREEEPKHGVGPAQQEVTEIRFLPRLHGVDIRGPEEVDVRESRREQRVLGLSLIACEWDTTSS